MTQQLEAGTLTALLRLRARQPGRGSWTYLDANAAEISTLSCAELDAWASEIAAGLVSHAKPGSRALLAFGYLGRRLVLGAASRISLVKLAGVFCFYC